VTLSEGDASTCNPVRKGSDPSYFRDAAARPNLRHDGPVCMTRRVCLPNPDQSEPERSAVAIAVEVIE
jgi:hypothetical protein